jgi:hypothetical protein
LISPPGKIWYFSFEFLWVLTTDSPRKYLTKFLQNLWFTYDPSQTKLLSPFFVWWNRRRDWLKKSNWVPKFWFQFWLWFLVR